MYHINNNSSQEIMKISTSWNISDKTVDYEEALEIMENYVDMMILKKKENQIWLLEHTDVYTAGSSARKDELINNDNIKVVQTNRGGKFTYHGTGQRIIYPMLDLSKYKDIQLYINNLEKWIISTLNKFDIDAFTKNKLVGIWVVEKNVEKKIAAIGIRVRKWIAYHGIAVNINPNLQKFSGIVPCGIHDFGVTSMNKLGRDVSYRDFDTTLKEQFKEVFDNVEN